MAVRVAPGAGDVAAELDGSFVVQVTAASDAEAAARALERARWSIAGLAGTEPGVPGGPVLSHPVLAPGGPLLRVAQLEVHPDLVGTVPDLVAKALEEADVADGLVTVIVPRGPLDGLDACPGAVVLRAFPRPAGEVGVLPGPWLDLAADWVLGELAGEEPVPARLLGAPFEVAAAEAPEVLHHAARARAWCDLAHGELSDRVRTASLTFGTTPHLALAAGGPGCDDEAILARYELLCEVARELGTEAAYTCIDVELTFAGLGVGIDDDGWRRRGGAPPNVVAAELVDVRVPDAFPYQLLGPAHLERLHEVHPEAVVGDQLADGRTEVMIGAPDDWFPWLDGRDEIRAVGWVELAPLLVTDAELPELLEARPAHPSAPPGAAVSTGGVVDLDEVVLEASPHLRRGLRLTLLELVAWLAHERHSDAPATVSPVLAAFTRWFASALDDERRQLLKRFARPLIGTRAVGDDERTALPPEDGARAWLATDWLLRAQAPAWLRAAGFEVAAAQLEDLGPTDDPYELRRALDILAEVLTTPDRGDPTGGHRADPTLVPRLVWDAWEVASEQSGWVAASEAAGHGIPPDVAYAVELRVIECARDDHTREQVVATGASMVDEARAAGWRAAAHQAWTAGLAAAVEAIDERARVPFASAFDRARQAVVRRAGIDGEQFDAAADAGERAAHRALAEAGRRRAVPEPDRTVWDEMLEAATAEPDAAVWAEAIGLAKEAVEEDPWTEGRYAAAIVAEAILRDAPDQVERAVGAAFAREAAGFAARELALEVAADLLAHGADEATTAAELTLALEPTVDVLRESALGLLEAMIDADASSYAGDEGEPAGA